MSKIAALKSRTTIAILVLLICLPAAAQSVALRRYLAEVEAKIQLHWSVDKTVREGVQNKTIGGDIKTPHVRFSVKPDGTIENPYISQSSTNGAVDQAAVECVKQSAPFQPLPADAPKGGVDMDMGLRITLVEKDQEKDAEQSATTRSQANSLLLSGDWQSAAKLLTDFLAAHPDDKLVRAKLVDVYLNQAEFLKTKDREAAIGFIDKAASIDPGSMNVKQARADFGLKESPSQAAQP